MVLLKLIRVKETIFSLPLAFIGVLIAADHMPPWSTWFYVTTALVAARTLGMCLNRLFDRTIDAQNPRTANRLLPSGQLSVSTVIRYAVLFAMLLVGSAYMLNTLCFYLSFLALFLLITYSLLKRVSSMTHLYLGLTEACAPIGGALAVRPEFSLEALIMGLYVVLWVAGFDIIYACQDYRFDQRNRLFSIPATYGLKKALIVSAVFHVAAVLTLCLAGLMVHANILYWLCLLVVCSFFVWQHTLVSEKNLTRVSVAFFNANRNISLTVFLAFLLNFIF